MERKLPKVPVTPILGSAASQCNVMLGGIDYTTDFLCTRLDGGQFIRECVDRKKLVRPMTIKLLDMSLEYWKSHGIKDWGIVIDEEK